MDWTITVSYLDVLQRPQYYMEQPIWFHCDQALHYEAATRIPVRKTLSTALAWCTHHIAHFESIRYSFRDPKSLKRLRESDTSPTKETFVDIHYSDEEQNISDMAEEKLSSRFYREVTQILQLIHSTIGLINWIQPNTIGRSFYMWVQNKVRKHYFPSILCFQLSQIIRKPSEPTRVIRCWHIRHHGRDRTQWIQSELEYLWLHPGIFAEKCLTDFKDTVSSGLLDAASSASFRVLRYIQTDIILWT